MNMTDIILKVSTSNPNCKRFRFVVKTSPRLNKTNRTTKEPTNFSVEKQSEFIASIGVNYEDEVNNILESQGLARDYKAQKAPGKHYVNGTNYLMESDKTPGKFYIALSRFENSTTTYKIDGVVATPEQVENLKTNYLQKTTPNLVPWRTYSIESIESIEEI